MPKNLRYPTIQILASITNYLNVSIGILRYLKIVLFRTEFAIMLFQINCCQAIHFTQFLSIQSYLDAWISIHFLYNVKN